MKYLKLFNLICLALLFSSFIFPGKGFQQDKYLVREFEKHHKKLIVLRHNESLNNFQDIVTSSRSPGYSLTQEGLEELTENSKKLASEGITVVYTSPLYRSLQAAELYGRTYGLTPEQLVVDDRLSIQKFGTYEGAKYADYKHLFGSVEKMLKGRAPGGEKGKSVFERTRNFLWDIVETSDDVILVLTHAFNCCHVNMLLTGEFGELPTDGEYIIYDFTCH